MSYKKLSRIQKNILTGLLCQVVTILLSFFMPRLYMSYYGSDVNGELNTIKQLFAYLYLLEAGVGLATTQALYRPVAIGDHKGISEVLGLGFGAQKNNAGVNFYRMVYVPGLKWYWKKKDDIKKVIKRK